MTGTSPQTVLNAWVGRRVRLTRRDADGQTEELLGTLSAPAWVDWVETGRPSPSGRYNLGSFEFNLASVEEDPEVADGRVVLKLAQGVELTVEPEAT